jgi:hypothetical protein
MIGLRSLNSDIVPVGIDTTSSFTPFFITLPLLRLHCGWLGLSSPHASIASRAARNAAARASFSPSGLADVRGVSLHLSTQGRLLRHHEEQPSERTSGIRKN